MKQKRKLSRKWKIIGNLAIALLLAALALVLWGWPTWMDYWAFRHLEAEYLLTPSTVVRTNRSEDGKYASYLSEGEGWITVGRTAQVEYGALPFPKAIPSINHLLPKEGIVVAALSAPNEDGGLTVAVWGAPDEAVSGTLEVDLTNVDGSFWKPAAKETVAAQARREGNWFFFQLSCGTSHGEGKYCALSALWDWDAAITYGFVGEHPYRLSLMDGQGVEVASQSGTLPPQQHLIDR